MYNVFMYDDAPTCTPTCVLDVTMILSSFILRFFVVILLCLLLYLNDIVEERDSSTEPYILLQYL